MTHATVRGASSRPLDPDPEAVFGALDDPACRDIVEAIDESMSVRESSERAGLPHSTTYKKLDRPREASLVAEETQLDPGGHHRCRYVLDFERVVVALDEARRLSVRVEGRLATPERHLLEMWSAVRRET